MKREDAAAVALASVRLEGLDPGEIEPLSQCWVRGELTTDEFVRRAQRLAAGEPIEDLLPTPKGECQ